MGLGIPAIRLNLELWQRGLFRDIKSVIEMGSQDIALTQTDLEELVHTAGLSDYKKEKFALLADWPKRSSKCSSRLFYELLGIKEYSCIDIDGHHGAIPLDLNLPLEDRSLYDRYDLVTDYGTNEHVFNTGEAYRTMHRLCKQQGIMIIIQSIFHGNGYFAYDPSFFEGMAAANNYKILFSSYLVDANARTQTGSELAFHVPLSRELLHVLDWAKVRDVDICYVMQKNSDADFHYPYQGEALTKAQRNCGYQLQFLPNPPSYSYVPINQPENVPYKLLLQGLRKKAIRRIKTYLRLR